MKKIKFLLILLAFILVCINVFAAASHPFNVSVSGKGKQAIVFIPGFTCSGDVWNETTIQLSRNYKCYTLTMPGFAGQKAQDEPSLKGWVKDIIEFIKTEKIEKPIVIGHSMGGVLALMLASDHPDKIAKIVVVDALPCLSAVFNPAFKSVETPDCSKLIETYTQMDNAKFAVAQAAGVKRLVADTSKYQLITQWGIQTDRKTYGKMYCDLTNTDLRAQLSSIKCPALILLEAPFKQFDSVMRAQYAQLASAQIEYSSKALHFIMYDDKDWYMTQLTTFIK
ncbi:alpha/beta hydrolase [Solitalea sp. MAHUQ-68]|uniref:Alpha/beta hydrolase n=1 Tax=Solitalea agri TaxID=2953739 RepID=A0A9X2JCL4_9SPHI|nr:alpha/beta hydrolase [Solitalea agri]MCO4293198.1 alpha/beta hydrolase [Solitalea agri]